LGQVAATMVATGTLAMEATPATALGAAMGVTSAAMAQGWVPLAMAWAAMAWAATAWEVTQGGWAQWALMAWARCMAWGDMAWVAMVATWAMAWVQLEGVLVVGVAMAELLVAVVEVAAMPAISRTDALPQLATSVVISSIIFTEALAQNAAYSSCIACFAFCVLSAVFLQSCDHRW
jgi:hypothetical protein